MCRTSQQASRKLVRHISATHSPSRPVLAPAVCLRSTHNRPLSLRAVGPLGNFITNVKMIADEARIAAMVRARVPPPARLAAPCGAGPPPLKLPLNVTTKPTKPHASFHPAPDHPSVLHGRKEGRRRGGDPLGGGIQDQDRTQARRQRLCQKPREGTRAQRADAPPCVARALSAD